jgi:hypothetical protein
MRYLRSVIDHVSGFATPAEMAAIDADNERLGAEGHWVLAAGLTPPRGVCVIDARGEDPRITAGPLHESAQYVAGFWIIEAPSDDDALRLAAEGSRACNRRVEVRPFLGG